MRRVALPLEEISRRGRPLTTSRGIARRPTGSQRVQPSAESAVAILGAPRDRRQPDDLGIGELECSRLAEEHRGCRRSKGHASRYGSSWTLWLLCRESYGSDGGDE